MSYEIEIFSGGEFIKRSFCLRQAVAYLQYRDARGQAYARTVEGGKTLEEMLAELGTLGQDEDCKGCNEEKKTAAKKK